ncbi:hypothetical protein [Actinoplanes sp. DH11]|uniref:hypothetical protein n=1 Tax=Actinoplanes sp. DH11 TaxID=2857011 RepID=UPI001E2F3302|nr:hypothetical protein [Actinoplanes sp. DH11]
MRKFATPAPVSAVLDIPAGRIRFIAADRADTTVEILPADASRSRDVKAAEHISVGAAREASATLDAGTSYGRIHNALNNTDGAAAGLNIHATTAHGDITARSL